MKAHPASVGARRKELGFVVHRHPEMRGEERNTLQKNANSQGRRNEKTDNLQSSVQETTRDAEIIG